MTMLKDEQIAEAELADWRKLARACSVEEDRVLTLLTEMARSLPDHISAARAQAVADGLSEKAVAPLARQLIRHVKERLASIGT